MFDIQRIAYAAWTEIAQPADSDAAALIGVVGAEKALAIVENNAALCTAEHEAFVTSPHRTGKTLDELLAGWRGAYSGRSQAQANIEMMARLGGGLLTPEDEHWPMAAKDQATTAVALWWRGNLENGLPELHNSMAIVGSRDATEYGRQITAEIASAAVRSGVTVFSGGSYGIDAAAHTAALAEETQLMPTVALQAGGLDRLYPAGNDDLLRRVTERGLLLSAVAPGAAPTRSRFLNRNRLMASMVGATIVTEARWRSGALTTARDTFEDGRKVGAVPGSVFSANSAGTHRLIRDGFATLVTDGAEALQLLPLKP